MTTKTTYVIQTKEGPYRIEGVVVDETDGQLAIDARDDGEYQGWVITHLRTGLRIPAICSGYPLTLEDATARAQRFYREFQALGADLATDSAEAICAPIKKLSAELQRAMYDRVQGIPESVHQ